jgi:hypothetical protein
MESEERNQFIDKAYWRRHVEDYQASGLKKVTYCTNNNVPYHKFLYWHNKLTRKRTNQLMPVKIKSAIRSEALCVLELKQGRRVLIYDEGILLKLLNWLEK